MLATGAYRAVQDRGLRMPGDLSLIGFDDEPWTTLVRPELTVVEQPTYELGTRAGRQMLDRIADRGRARRPHHVELQAKFVARSSTLPG
ncbi:substrate-binding domain-containing protein [Amycolatopsis sp. NPDC026612]|uniref:substrate-binding domain-containing protein n=1 Tax=Amycolatopsis sp. NPDC026612 TaxID=3155466 RepID=UPI0033FED462